MKTPKSVKINGVSQINAQKTNTESGFSLETDLHFLSDNVIKDSSSSESYPDFEDEPQEGKMPDPPEPPEEKKPFNWGKLACNVLAGLAVVAAVTATVALVAVTAGAAAPVVGAIVAGGLISGTAAVGSMAASDIRRGEVSDIKDYMAAGAREAFVGAVSGAVFGPFGTGETLGGKMLLGATTNAFESIVRQKLNGEDIDWGVVAGDGIFGGLTAGAFHYGGKALKSGSNYVKKSVCRVLSKNESSLMKLGKNLDDMFAKSVVVDTGFGKYSMKAENSTMQDRFASIIGKANNTLEKDLLPAERAAKKGFEGIKTTANGGPDFSASKYIKRTKDGEPIIATIEMSGSRSKDFTRAFDDVNIPSSERKKILEDYTWHHVDDYDEATGKCTMQLVEKDAHKATYPHKGSCAQYDKVHGETYNKKYNGMTPKEKAEKNGFIINETENGGADFAGSDYIYKLKSGNEAVTKIRMSGSRRKDAKKIYEKFGMNKEMQKKLSKEYKIFYLDDFDPDTGECTVQLVKSKAANIVNKFAGAQAQFKSNTGIKYIS